MVFTTNIVFRCFTFAFSKTVIYTQKKAVQSTDFQLHIPIFDNYRLSDQHRFLCYKLS